MSRLPIVEPPSPRWRRQRRWTIPVHVCRVCLFVGVLLLIRQKQVDFNSARPNAEQLNQIQPGQLLEYVPDAKRIDLWDSTVQSRRVIGDTETQIASLIQTSPASDSIVGYTGPTNLMVVLSPEQRVLHVQILESADTIEHVDAIRSTGRFLDSYRDLPWNRPEHWPEIDAVSGATLTCYAIVQSLAARAGREMQGLKFPIKITRDEIVSCFVEDVGRELAVESPFGNESLIQISEAQPGERVKLGYLARTSPNGDSLVGYQGPTDALLVLDQRMNLIDIRIRSSFDNEPYVGYVKDDSYLNELLYGKSLDEIAALPDDRYEGVSGATMTSLNVWDGVRLTAGEISASLDQQRSQSPRDSKPNLTWRDIATATVCLIGILLGLTRLRTFKRIRFCFLILVIVYLGFISGDMLSQTVMVGWAQHGLPMTVAPGFVLLCFAALAVPVVSKHNVYCGHICPLGAIQQVSKNRLGRRIRLPHWLTGFLKLVPAALIIGVVLTAYNHLNLNLASVEAFDAFSFRVAGWITICIAVVGLSTSLFVPMAYCRFGCPTGAVLSYLRFNSNSWRVGPRDLLAIAALILGLVL